MWSTRFTPANKAEKIYPSTIWCHIRHILRQAATRLLFRKLHEYLLCISIILLVIFLTPQVPLLRGSFKFVLFGPCTLFSELWFSNFQDNNPTNCHQISQRFFYHSHLPSESFYSDVRNLASFTMVSLLVHLQLESICFTKYEVHNKWPEIKWKASKMALGTVAYYAGASFMPELIKVSMKLPSSIWKRVPKLRHSKRYLLPFSS